MTALGETTSMKQAHVSGALAESSPEKPSGLPEMPARLVVLSPRSLAGAGLAALAVIGVTGFGYLARDAFAWILVALILALALRPAVVGLERHGLSRGSASALVFVLAAAGLALTVALVLPPLVDEVTALVRSLPALVDDLANGRGKLGFLESDYQLVERVRSAVGEREPGDLLGSGAPALGLVRTALETAGGLVAVAFVTLFMLRDGPSWMSTARSAVPASGQPSWDRVTEGIARAVGGYVTGNLLLSVIAGFYATVVLLALGVPYAVPLGLIVAVLDLVPAVGATGAAILACLVALASDGILTALIVLAALVVYQQIENHALQPLVYGRTVELSPLAVSLALLIGAEMGGILGILVAVPIAGSLKVLADELFLRRGERRLEPTQPAAVPEVEHGRPE